MKWQGFSEEEATWEPRKNILSKQLIEEFEAARKRRKVDDQAGELHEVWLNKQDLDGELRFGLEVWLRRGGGQRGRGKRGTRMLIIRVQLACSAFTSGPPRSLLPRRHGLIMHSL